MVGVISSAGLGSQPVTPPDGHVTLHLQVVRGSADRSGRGKYPGGQGASGGGSYSGGGGYSGGSFAGGNRAGGRGSKPSYGGDR